jgi:hypothetical protein
MAAVTYQHPLSRLYTAVIRNQVRLSQLLGETSICKHCQVMIEFNSRLFVSAQSHDEGRWVEKYLGADLSVGQDATVILAPDSQQEPQRMPVAYNSLPVAAVLMIVTNADTIPSIKQLMVSGYLFLRPPQ